MEKKTILRSAKRIGCILIFFAVTLLMGIIADSERLTNIVMGIAISIFAILAIRLLWTATGDIIGKNHD